MVDDLNGSAFDVAADGSLLERMSKTKLWQIIKALPFSGGPSATKWVYLAMNLVIAIVINEIASSVCWVYVHTPDHHVDSGMLAAIGSLVLVASSCATLALGQRAKLKAQSSSVDGSSSDNA